MEEEWSVPDVYLLTEGPDGSVAVPQLVLTFLPGGLTLAKADGETVWTCAWERLEELSVVERAVLPDGREAVVVLVVERGRRQRQRHRFALATDDPASAEASVIDRAAAHGLRTTPIRSPVSRALTVSIVLAAVATMALLILSAVHVFRF